MAAVKDTIVVEPVRCADRGPGGLTALAGLRAFRTEEQPTGSVIRAKTIHTVEAAAAPCAIVSSRARTPFITATVQRTIAVVAIVSADRGSAALTALLG